MCFLTEFDEVKMCLHLLRSAGISDEDHIKIIGVTPKGITL